MTDIQQAREWAENGAVKVNSGEVVDEIAKAAVRVIQSLPDQFIDADKVRALIASLNAWTEDADAERSHGRALGYRTAAENLAALLPAPSLPTLADMTPDERQASVGMWCDNLVSTAKEPAPVVLACVQGDQCWILHTNIHGERSCFPLGSVAPRPDMPRAWSQDGTPVSAAEWETTNE